MTDAEFLAHHICAASAVGLTEADLSVLLQMSPRCAYGFSRLFPGERPYSPARFRAALSELASVPEVAYADGRWYPATAPTWCAYPACRRPLDGTRRGTRYCSSACRGLDRRRSRAASNFVRSKAQVGTPQSAHGAPEYSPRPTRGARGRTAGAVGAPSVPKVPGGTQLNLHLSPTAPVGTWRAKRSRRPK